MPLCKGCGEAFSSRLKVEGRTVAVPKRKFCLTCHPFGWRGRHRDGDRPKKGPKCTCTSCGRSYTYVRGRGGTRKVCNSCLVNRRRFEIKRRAVAYKGGRCELCTYDRCLEAMTFHHRDPAQKDFAISGAHARSWKVIQAELDKCVLLCNRCHTETHAGLHVL